MEETAQSWPLSTQDSDHIAKQRDRQASLSLPHRPGLSGLSQEPLGPRPRIPGRKEQKQPPTAMGSVPSDHWDNNAGHVLDHKCQLFGSWDAHGAADWKDQDP